MNTKLRILFEDKHCVVVDKPARLLVASDKTGDETLLGIVRAYNESKQEPGKKGYLVPLHFLDRPVSGVIIFARSSKAASRLSDDFRKRRIKKIYEAWVEGEVQPKSNHLVDFLVKDRESNKVRTVSETHPEGKRSALDYEVVERKSGLTRVNITLGTGRSHQIRVQFASRGWPIVGDRKYGSKLDCGGRIALRAIYLEFTHPVSKEIVKIDAGGLDLGEFVDL